MNLIHMLIVKIMALVSIVVKATEALVMVVQVLAFLVAMMRAQNGQASRA